jgi:hypothetical protein
MRIQTKNKYVERTYIQLNLLRFVNNRIRATSQWTLIVQYFSLRMHREIYLLLFYPIIFYYYFKNISYNIYTSASSSDTI